MNQAPVKNQHEPVFINLPLLGYLYHRSGKKQENLAAETGLSIAHVGRALSGHRYVSLQVYGRLANALNSKLKFITDPDIDESQFHHAVVPDGKSGGAVRGPVRARGRAGRSKAS